MATAYEHELHELESELEGEMESGRLCECEAEGEMELEGEGELEFEGEGELEFEMEGEGELESEISPVRKIYADAMMEHLAHMAAESESEQEAAEHFLPLIGMAAKKLLPVVARAVAPAIKRALPKIARAVTRVEPALTRGIGKVTRALYRQPATRHLIRAVPSIARRTMHSVARQVAAGRPMTPRTAVRTFSNQARMVLGSPPRRRVALGRSAALDRRFHVQMGPGMVRPHVTRPGTAWSYGAWPQAGRRIPVGSVRAPYGHACPTCGRSGPPAMAPVPAPAYCRCCGQLIR